MKPFLKPPYFTLLKAGFPDISTRVTPILDFRCRRNQVIHLIEISDRRGNKGIGGGDDHQGMTLGPVGFDQLAGGGQ